jgi:hypothetical protein
MAADKHQTIKIIERAKRLCFLMLHRVEGTPYKTTSSIFEIYEGLETRGSTNIEGEAIFRTNTPINDFTMTTTGSIWAIDVLGNLFTDTGQLSPLENSDIQFESINTWSIQNITGKTPTCIAGEDDDLWIATVESNLIHYNGTQFSEVSFTPDAQPVRMIAFNKHDFILTTFNSGIYEYDGNEWEKLALTEHVPDNIIINDVTLVNGVRYAVSTAGYILKEVKEGLFDVELYDPSKPWYACTELDGELYLAGGTGGAHKYLGNGHLEFIKQYDSLIGASSSNKRLFFTLADSITGTFVEYTPNDENEFSLIM